MKPLTPETKKVLLEGARRHDGRLNPCCDERHRKALVSRGLVDRDGRVTFAGMAAALSEAAKETTALIDSVLPNVKDEARAAQNTNYDKSH